MAVFYKDKQAVTTDGRYIDLTDDELKILRTISRLDKMDFGRLELFGNGRLTVRLSEDGSTCWHSDEIMFSSIPCEGGCGGD